MLVVDLISLKWQGARIDWVVLFMKNQCDKSDAMSSLVFMRQVSHLFRDTPIYHRKLRQDLEVVRSTAQCSILK